MRQTKNHLLQSKTTDNYRLNRINISQIPKVIEQFYSNANKKSKEFSQDNLQDMSLGLILRQ